MQPEQARSGAGRRVRTPAWLAVLLVVVLAGAIAALLVVSLSPSSSAKPRGPTIGVSESPLGSILVDSRGLTLYTFSHDGRDTSSCMAVCAHVWPPAAVTGTPTAGAGIALAKLATITRPDGVRQLVYYGHPLYTFTEDTHAGQLGGEGFLGAWYAVSPTGQRVVKAGGEKPAQGY